MTQAETMSTESIDNSALMQLAAPVSEQVDIERIVLVDAKFTRGSAPIASKTQVELQVGGTTEHLPETQRINVKVKFVLRARALDAAESGGELFGVEGTFLLVYRIAHPENIGKENFEAFGRLNGLFNAWPYWREFVQSATNRMGVPPITVPALKVIGKPISVGDE